MLLMFHFLLISLFSSYYLSIISFSFSQTLVSPGIAISIMIQLRLFLFITTIPGFSVTLDHNIPQNLHFFIFNNTFQSMFIPFFTPYQVVFSTQFPMNYSCNIVVPCLVLLLVVKFLHSVTI